MRRKDVKYHSSLCNFRFHTGFIPVHILLYRVVQVPEVFSRLALSLTSQAAQAHLTRKYSLRSRRKRGRGRGGRTREKNGGLGPSSQYPIFLPRSGSPSLSPFTPATQARESRELVTYRSYVPNHNG